MTVLSFGAGQDSTYLVVRLIKDPEFRKKHIVEPLIVAGSDTGDEHPHTYENILKVQQLCRDNNIPFRWIKPEDGFHARTWQSLFGQYKLNTAIGSAAFKQTCTDKLKIYVMDNFVEYCLKRLVYEPTHPYTWSTVAPTKKRIYYEYTRMKGRKIRLILGFAAGEERRIANGDGAQPKWKRDTVERYFPLIEDGVDRQQCIDYLEANFGTVFPSNCMRCFYQSDQEILWLYRFYPEKFWEWVQLEKNKLAKCEATHREMRVNTNGDLVIPKNLGVYGTMHLEQKLAKAQRLYGHWSDRELMEYKYSHGHCVKSKY